MKKKLQDCPFCGNNTKCELLGSFGLVNEKSTADFYYVVCGKCGAQGGIRKTEGWAIKTWNKRA